MKKQPTDEDLTERSSIDGRVSFAMAAFALGAGLIGLLDRVGVPERIVGFLGPVLALGSLAMIGLLLHAVRVSRYYAAGRAVPSPYAGLALAGLGTAMVIPFVPPVSVDLLIQSLLPGFAIGFLIIALVNGPLLRKTGAFSLPDLIASRFPNPWVRFGSIVVVGTSAMLVALAGYEGSIRALAYALGADRLYGSMLVAFVLMLMIIPGGMAGVVWAATGGTAVFIAALCLPLAGILLGGDALPVPIVGDHAGWQAAMTRIAQWQQSTYGSPGDILAVVAIAIGVACLAPLLSPAITTHDSHSARRAGVSAIIWGLAVAAIIAVTLSVSAQALDEYLVGERPDRLPAFAYAASGGGLLRICGAHVLTPEQALAACRELTGFGGLLLRAQDISPQGIWLMLGLPESYGFGVAFSGLVAAAIVSASLILAGAGFQTFGTAIGHDGLYRTRDNSALTSRRLAMTRVVIVIGIIACGTLLSAKPADAQQLIGLAILISTAAIAPLLALAMWPRASGSDAAIAMLASLIFAAGVLAIQWPKYGIEGLSFAALVAALAGLLTGIAVSFLHSGGLATQGSAFVHGLIYGETDVLNRDKGA